jgi:alpha-mannosidase
MIVRFASALTDLISTSHSSASPFSLVNGPNVQLETVKRAEDDDHKSSKATIIIRLFEQFGGHAKPTLKMYVRIASDHMYASGLMGQLRT